MKGLYKVIKNLISEEEAHEISEVIKKNPKNQGDTQSPQSYAYYNLPVCNILLGRLLDIVSKASGKRLKPTYTYCRVYLKGADLKPHKDRPSCEYSVTLNLSQTHPWPIFMGKRAVTQNPGDGVLYKGCEIEHSRQQFTGDEYVQVFLHYVNSDGPFKNYIYDQREETIYRFVFGNQNIFENHVNYYKFDNPIDVDMISNLLETKELVPAQIGSGEINVETRRSKIFWLPKTDEFVDIYKIFHEMIGQSNETFFKFKLSEITEHIQYTVYTEEDQGYYNWHLDMGPGKANRKLSLVCQLSDPSEYEGGELQINTGHIMKVEKKKGHVVIFPSYLLHCVTPVTKGTRRTLVLWVEGPAFQ